MSDAAPGVPGGVADVEESWPVDSTRDLHRDSWVVALREDRVRRPGHEDEGSFRRLVVEHPGAVVILALDEVERVCCLRQYRHAPGKRLIELPAGLLDSGEPPLATAQRELREEVELQAAQWRELFAILPSPGISAERQHLFLARGLSRATRGDFVLEHEEADFEVAWVPLPELIDAVLDGRVADAPLVAAVLAYDALRNRGRA